MSDKLGTHSQRPLSPHLQIYKPQMTSVLSILHRATGVALAFGTLMLVWLLVAAATSEQAYDQFMAFSGSPLGLFMLFGWTVALYYHMCNGVRHLIWDTGAMMKMKQAKWAGLIVLLATVVLSVVTWFFALTL